jgi:hypothetical protein
MMKVVYVALSLAPTAAVLALAAYVLVRAVSFRIVWREGTSPLDDEPAS